MALAPEAVLYSGCLWRQSRIFSSPSSVVCHSSSRSRNRRSSGRLSSAFLAGRRDWSRGLGFKRESAAAAAAAAAVDSSTSEVESAAEALKLEEESAAEGVKLEEELVRKEEEDGAAGSSKRDEEVEFEKGFSMRRVCDRLIEVFMVDRPDPDEWRKLLAFSQEWRRIRPYFYERCKALAESEDDPRKMGNLYKLSRKLKEVDDEMIRHDELLEEIEVNETEIDVIVAKRRKDFTSDFFKHLRVLCDANHSNLDRREKLAQLAARCLASVEEYDKGAENSVALDAARRKFDDILNSSSLQDACKKIDTLVKNKQFDPTLMLVISKAWAAAKESPLMKEEVKDIMFHLYNVAKGNMQRLVPKEVRILKHLLTIEDPRERLGALAQAFSPGDELEGKDIDLLYTTPNRLYRQVLFILDAYYSNKEKTLIQEAQKLMDPLVISRLEILRDVIKTEFL
ncbi:uncharacterized protein At4g37920 [Selaginella moellendorffii]|uniref:uncharacterized protein At4g37920 n=1 Tax=Selaginella moellendorffii TaxID=88036 RepID=UPI000D1C57A9|nr:uncharacterized protein At4g37920 [Selaginella moellendorffii]|eukprot:XP_002980392.2 uncharacterized protein At4g37920 [Selaginella moellendorffii]